MHLKSVFRMTLFVLLGQLLLAGPRASAQTAAPWGKDLAAIFEAHGRKTCETGSEVCLYSSIPVPGTLTVTKNVNSVTSVATIPVITSAVLVVKGETLELDVQVWAASGFDVVTGATGQPRLISIVDQGADGSIDLVTDGAIGIVGIASGPQGIWSMPPSCWAKTGTAPCGIALNPNEPEALQSIYPGIVHGIIGKFTPAPAPPPAVGVSAKSAI
jgi:hypothetical protein